MTCLQCGMAKSSHSSPLSPQTFAPFQCGTLTAASPTPFLLLSSHLLTPSQSFAAVVFAEKKKHFDLLIWFPYFWHHATLPSAGEAETGR